MKPDYYKFVRYISFIFLSLLFLLVFSSSTSPLFNTYGDDSAIFILLGKMFLNGMTPYVDFFDHKGPVLIFLEALGISIYPDNERTGIFILQVINLLFIQIYIYKIARCFLSTIKSLAVVFLSLLLFSFTIQGGNLTEEFSLPFTLWSLWFTIKTCFSNNNTPIKTWQIILLGIFSGLLFWIRPNNAGIICGCVFYLIYFCSKKKERMAIKNLLIYTLVGFLIITLPLFSYFIITGALKEMLYASIEFNLKYLKYDVPFPFTGLQDHILHIIKTWTAILVLIIGTFVYYIKTKKQEMIILSLFLLLFSIISTQTGQNYYHYMTLNIPCFILGIILIIKSCNNLSPKLIFLSSFLALTGYMVLKYNNIEYQQSQDDSEFQTASLDIISIIPENQKKLIYTYNIPAKFWLIIDQYPSYKYFVHQDWHGMHDPQISEEINKALKNIPPLWIVTPISDKPINLSFNNFIEQNYSIINKNEYFILYYINPVNLF